MQNGTGTRRYLGIDVAGKTGTAERERQRQLVQGWRRPRIRVVVVIVIEDAKREWNR
ncbi:MAG: hypothetical protein ACLTMP_04650 [Eggerthella lenta]